MRALLLAATAVVPALLLLWWVHSRDRNPEPGGLVTRVFLLGVFLCLPAYLVESLLEPLAGRLPGGWTRALFQGFVVAAFTEEGLKFAALRLFVWKRPEFDEPMDGIVYGATVSLGFAALENLLYVGSHGPGTAAMRALTAVPAHALDGVVLGAFVGRARFDPVSRDDLLVKGFLGAMAFHGAYDALLMTGDWPGTFAGAVLLVQGTWALRLVDAMRARQLTTIEAVLAGPAGVAAVEIAVLGTRRRPVRSGLKLLVGGALASVCWTFLVFALGAAAEAGPEGIPAAQAAWIGAPALLGTLLSVLLFRSGLRGLYPAGAA